MSSPKDSALRLGHVHSITRASCLAVKKKNSLCVRRAPAPEVRVWLCSSALANSKALVAINCSQGEMLNEKLSKFPYSLSLHPLSPRTGLVSLEISEHHASKNPLVSRKVS